MKKFLAAICAAGLLMTGCGGNKSATTDKPETIEFTANDVAGMQIQAINATGDEVEVDKNAFKKAAGQQIDWKSAPRFDNQFDLTYYVLDARDDLKTTVPVVLTNGFEPDYQALVNDAAIWYLQRGWQTRNGQTFTLLTLKNYPGERVARAYFDGDTSDLDAEEMQLYNEAVKIVDEAKNFSNNLLYRELYIHDAITSRVAYYTEKPQPTCARFQTALGGLIDGKANCQGYSDTFYMLATMCGLNVGKVSGDAGGGPHMWNTVNFGDDRNYFMDVTWDDGAFNTNSGEYTNYIYFNAPSDIASATHQWSDDYVPDIQPVPDGRYEYYTKEFNNSNGRYFATHTDNAEDALRFIAKRIGNEGWRSTWVCAPYDANYTDNKKSLNHLLNDLLPAYGWRGSVTLKTDIRGKYMFFTADARANN